MPVKGKNYLTDVEWSDRIDKLIDLLRKGIYIDVACKKIGLTRKTFYKWLEAAREGTGGPEHLEFARRVDEALADFEIGAIGMVMDIVKENHYFPAIAWLLERKFPERYADPNRQIKVVQEVQGHLEQVLESASQVLKPEDYAKLLNHLNKDPSEREDFSTKSGSELVKQELDVDAPEIDEETQKELARTEH